MSKNVLKYCCGIGVSILLLMAVFHQASVEEMMPLITQADRWLLGITLVISVLFNVLFTAYRWQLILEKFGVRVSWHESLLMKMGGNVVSRFLPLKAGEITRVVYLRRVKNIAYNQATVAVMLEYILNFLVLGIFMVLGVLLFLRQSGEFTVGLTMSLPVLSVLAVNSSITESGPWLAKIKIVLNLMRHTFQKEFRAVLTSPWVWFCSVLLLGAQLINFYLIALAFGVQLPVFSVLYYLPITIIAACAPVSLAGLGVREAVIMLFYAPYASSGVLLSIGLTYSLVEFIFPSAVGVLFLGAFIRAMVQGHAGQNNRAAME